MMRFVKSIGIALAAMLASPGLSQAQDTGSSALGEVSEAICSGRFINPITDVCWDCMFPITVGSIPVVPLSRPDKPTRMKSGGGAGQVQIG
ncbi:MAG: TraU family protein, partial [Pseudomonadota bacterium]